MTSVTQKIPNFAGGISQQPDELMPQGSVRDAVNVLPDVTDGLRKRTGSRLVNPLVTEPEGTWFHFDYAPNQKYVGKIGLDGRVYMFNAADGLPAPVYYQAYDPTADLTGSQLETGFPNCDYEAMRAAKEAYEPVQKELDALEAEYNVLVSESEGEEVQRFINYTPGQYVEREWENDGKRRSRLEWQPPVVYQGYLSRSGPDIKEPLPPEGEGWKWRKGSKVFDASEVEIPKYAYGEPERAVVYVMEWYRPTGTIVTDELESKRAEIQAKKDELKPLYEAYVATLNDCGFNRPGENQRNTREIIASDVVPQYLEHDHSMQLKTLVVGDTIFVTNPKVNCSMLVGSNRPQRPTENFIELRTIAPAKVYTVELITPDSVAAGYTTVTAVEVSDAKFNTDGKDGCTLGGQQRKTFTGDDLINNNAINPGDRVNLDMTLTIAGVGTLDDDDDPQCNYTAEIKINNGGAGWQEGDIVEFEIKEKKYKVTINEIETKYANSGKYLFPPQSPSDGTIVKADEILADLEAVIEAEGYQCKIVGNGVYVSHPDPDHIFTFATPEGQLMNITTGEVNNISELPTQCVDGYLAKVANTDSDYDDYWVEFETEFGGMDGFGAWVETVAPNVSRVINPASMPHKIVKNGMNSFVVSPIEWEKRLVGDDKTNPRPSFISRPNKNEFNKINDIAFFRNRLCMLSGDNAILSRPGDYFNFFKGSALTLADNDPIDIAAGSTATSASSALESAIEIADGLLIFSAQEQNLLSTDSEVFGPNTARFARVGTYRYNGPKVSRLFQPDGNAISVHRGTLPVSLGNTIAFLHDSGLHSTMLEMYNIGRSQNGNVNELTKPIPRYLPYGINSIATSKDNNIVALSRTGTNDVYVYRYFDNDQKRLQSAWFRWKTLGTMIYQCIMGDVFWYISIGRSSSASIPEEDRDIVSLQRIDLKDELATAFVQDQFVESDLAGTADVRQGNDTPYQAHLDNYRIAQPSEFTYYDHLDQTYFRAPLVYYKDEADKGNLVAYMLSPTQFQQEATDDEGNSIYGPGKPYYFVSIGSLVPIRVEEDNLGTWFVMDGDWSKTRMMIGYQYEMKVEFPHMYATKTQQTTNGATTTSDTNSSLTLQRVKFNFGQTGVYEVTLNRKGRDVYTELYECKTADGYPANEVAFDQSKQQVVPVYAKNTDTDITLTSTHPSPATLVSLEWEGNFSNMYYKRV